MWERKKILITVKTYPEKSKTYGSSICVAGITDEGEWIRLYPVPFNYFMKKLRGMKKYSWIEVDVQKATEKLSRKESYKVKEDSIEIVDVSLTKASSRVWRERKKLVLPLLNSSIKELKADWEIDKTSLGLIKPELIDFSFRKPIDEVEVKRAKFLQTTLMNELILVANRVPHFMSYVFNCSSPECTTRHDISCEDWELFQSFRSWRRKYPDHKIKRVTSIEAIKYEVAEFTKTLL